VAAEIGEPPAGIFRAGETAEFGGGDPAKAVVLYRELARAPAGRSGQVLSCVSAEVCAMPDGPMRRSGPTPIWRFSAPHPSRGSPRNWSLARPVAPCWRNWAGATSSIAKRGNSMATGERALATAARCLGFPDGRNQILGEIRPDPIPRP